MPQLAEVTFGTWRPDLFGLDSNRLIDVNNALPDAQDSWAPFPSLAEIGQSVGAEVRGGIVIRKSDGSTAIYVGTAAKLYRYAGVGTAWTDVTRSSGGDYTLPSDAFWDFTYYANQIVAVQGGDAPQVINVDSGTNFAALSSDAPTARRAKFISGVLVLYDLVSAFASAFNGRSQFVNSGFNDPTFWTTGQRSSDFRTFLDGGPIAAITGRTTGLLIQRDIVRQIAPSTGDEIWNIRTIEEKQGTASPYSVIENRGAVFYYGRDGFVAAGAGSFSQEVGVQWVDDWFKGTVNLSRVGVIQGVLDPTRTRYIWLCPSAGNTSNVLDLLVGFDPKVGFFKADISATCILALETPATTLGDLGSGGLGYTLATMPAPFGSPVWRGGNLRLGAFTDNNKMAYFAGDPLEATFKTHRFQPIPGKRSYVAGYRILSDASDARGTTAASENPYATLESGSERQQESSGLLPGAQTGRWHQVTVRIPAGATWTKIRGLTLDEVRPEGTN